MNINGKTAGGFLLIVFGLSVFFGGGHFAFIIPLAIGGLMLYWGIKRFSKGRAVSGIIAGVIGAMILVGSLPFIVAIGLAGAMVYFGWKMMKQGSSDTASRQYEPEAASPGYQSGFDSEWEEFLKKK
ncbi:protein liaI [Bacillus velezensis]|uniref:protein liaI n=1 Tax=Bacillus TaxID=1386 RepID=UPI0007B6EC22|nr:MULTISPECIES: protein liaI [Bacillus amyloliquefaciens group]ANB84999.1 protein liaI [Bacillus velezensis]MCP1460762.1 lia operon protein LiaI [Bacillus amyloliquefaciens]MCP1532284.1 lia operon protein LiaI [Bacillus velezensis]QXP96447.1 protein liaI [Bacillus velezensis]UHH02306.1 protein liaI [Bacillus amyloliquefaciens]